MQPSMHFLHQGTWKPVLCRRQTCVLGKIPQGLGTVLPSAFMLHSAANTFYHIYEIYGSICELKCESGFDWSTFLLTAVIFDWL